MLEQDDRKAGLLLNITGNGKGKTTSALGMAVRALGWGWRVAVWQFIKGPRETGEREYFRKYHPDMTFETCGLGQVFQPLDHATAATEGWRRAREFLTAFDGDLLVFDELNVALGKGYLDCSEVLPALLSRPRRLNLVVTGRYAPQALLDASDLVSEIQNVKHPFQRGIPARKGLEY